jgi:hypothetical protein
MKRSFEYQVCRVNFNRVTFVNETWQGAEIPESKRKTEDVQSCPAVWDYLQRVGHEGWELVGAVGSSFASPEASPTVFRKSEQIPYQLLFLKREIGG